MLRHLGASYYQTLRGEASAADVARAVEAVTEFQAHGDTGGTLETGREFRQRGRWRVRDVMTVKAVTAGRNMLYKQAAKLMTDQRVTAIPVVSESGRVVAMVSDADLLHKVEPRSRGAPACPAGHVVTGPRRERAPPGS